MKPKRIAVFAIFVAVLFAVSELGAAEYYWNATAANPLTEPFDSVWAKMTRDPDDWSQDSFSGNWKSDRGETGTLEGSGYWWSTNGDSILASGTFSGSPPAGTWEGLFVLEDTCYGTFIVQTVSPPLSGTFAGFADRSPSPYLLIYADIFEDNADLNYFAEQKRKKGFDVEMVKLGDIDGVVYDSFFGEGWPGPEYSDVEAIREYIRNEWHNPNWVKPSYVLLVGDSRGVRGSMWGYEAEWADPEHLPTHQFMQPTYVTNTSDYYFQLMDDDDTADVALGRWCVNNDTELSTIVTKTLRHENPDIALGWEPNRTVLVAHFEDMYGPKPDYADSSELIRQMFEDWNIPEYEVYTAYGKAPGSIPPGPNNDTLRGYLEGNQETNGIGILNYIGHAGVDHWQAWNAWQESFSNDTVYSLTQTHHGYPLVYQFCCATGTIASWRIDDDDNNRVLCDAWTFHPDGGAAGALGISGTGIYGHDHHSTPMAKGIFSAHFEDNLDCGWAIVKGGIDFMNANVDFDSSTPDDTIQRRRVHITYWIGDPELDVWRATPEDAEISGQVVGNNYLITVLRSSDLAPVSNTQVCMYGEGVCHLVGYTDANGQAEFPMYPDPATYTFTATNQLGPICIRPVTLTQTVLQSAGVEENELKPELTVIGSNLGDAFTVNYQIPQPGNTNIAIYDVTGREVKTLVSGEQPAGSRELTWEGLDDAGRQVSAGVYFIRMQAGGFQANEKITLIR